MRPTTNRDTRAEWGLCGVIGLFLVWLVSLPIAAGAQIFGYPTLGPWLMGTGIVTTVGLASYGVWGIVRYLRPAAPAAYDERLLVRAISALIAVVYILFLYAGCIQQTIPPTLFLAVLCSGTILTTLFLIVTRPADGRSIVSSVGESIAGLWVISSFVALYFVQQNAPYFGISAATLHQLQPLPVLFNGSLFLISYIWNAAIPVERKRYAVIVFSVFALLFCFIVFGM